MRKLALSRIRKRIEKHIAKLRETHGDEFQICHLGKLNLFSIGERIELVILALVFLTGLYFGREIWWLYLLLLPPALFFLWKGVCGSQIDLSQALDQEVTTGDSKPEDSLAQDLEKRVEDVLFARGAAQVAVHVLMGLLMIGLEVAAGVMGVMAAVLGALAGS